MNSEINIRIAELAARRIFSGYTWQDIARIVNDEFNTNLTGDACWHRANRYKDLYESFVDEAAEETQAEEEFSDIDALLQAKDERNQANALYRRMSRENTLISIANEVADKMNKWVPLTSADPMYKSNTHNEAILMISDWHYGIDINNFFNVYSPEVCKQRVEELLNDVVVKIKENKIAKLHVLNLGDMIAGIIHQQLRINSRLDVMSQIMQVTEIIAEFLYELSKYVIVEYYQVLDNHSRLDPNKKEAMQLESLARMTPWYLEQRFKAIEKKYHSIHLNKNEIDQDISTFYIGGEFLVVGVHGDDDKQSTIFSKLGRFIKDEPDLICSAHLHHFTSTEDNRTLMISNGSLMGTDDFAFQKRLDSRPSQTFITFKNTAAGLDINGIYKLNSYTLS